MMAPMKRIWPSLILNTSIKHVIKPFTFTPKPSTSVGGLFIPVRIAL